MRGVVIVAAVIVLSACGGSSNTVTPTPTTRTTQQPPATTTHEVEYLLTFERAVPGTRATWTNESGGNEREDDLMSLRRTWEYTMPTGAHAYISASTGTDSQRVECTITVDGVEAETTYADGSHATATCSVIVGR